MSYGDLQFFDIIIFAGIAAFLIYRLRNVLGKRSGLERVSSDNNTESGLSKKETKDPPTLKENETELSKVYKVMPDFDHKNFLEGAKFAFETIINASRTEKIGDGKIFVYDLEQIHRIRTGETDQDAL